VDGENSELQQCSEGNLVDLSLRSTFPTQDHTTSSFLRELIDLSARPDSFQHEELNLTNKHQHTNAGNNHNHNHHSNTANPGHHTNSHHHSSNNNVGNHNGNASNCVMNDIGPAPSVSSTIHHYSSRASSSANGANCYQNIIYSDSNMFGFQS